MHSRELRSRVDKFLAEVVNSQNRTSNQRNGGKKILVNIVVDPTTASPFSANNKEFDFNAEAKLTHDGEQRTTLAVTATWGSSRIPFHVWRVDFHLDGEASFPMMIRGHSATGEILLEGSLPHFQICVNANITQESSEIEGYGTLCAQFTQCCESFTLVAENLHTTDSFFTFQNIEEWENQCLHENVEEPSFSGSSPSQTPFRKMALELQRDLYREANKFLDGVSDAVTKWTSEILQVAIPEANHRELLFQVIKEHIEECRRGINLDGIKAQYEYDLISAQEPTFDSNLTRIKLQVYRALSVQGKLGEVTSRRARDSLQDTLDGLSRLAAYWESTRLEFSRQVIRTVKLNLAPEKYIQRLIECLTRWIDEQQEDNLVALIGTSPEQPSCRQIHERRQNKNLSNSIDERVTCGFQTPECSRHSSTREPQSASPDMRRMSISTVTQRSTVQGQLPSIVDGVGTHVESALEELTAVIQNVSQSEYLLFQEATMPGHEIVRRVRQIMKDYSQSAKVQGTALKTLASLLSRKNQERSMLQDVQCEVQMIARAMKLHENNTDVQESACEALLQLIDADEIKSIVLNHGVLGLVHQAMENHRNNTGVLSAGGAIRKYLTEVRSSTAQSNATQSSATQSSTTQSSATVERQLVQTFWR